MADEEKKIIVDDDWKAQAQAEREKLAEEQQSAAQQLPDASFDELLNMIVMQALAGFGLMATPDGQRIPPNLGVAKHFVDMLQILADKTKGNLSDDEQQKVDQVLYELRMRFVELATGGAGAGPADPAGGEGGPTIAT